MPGLVVRAYHKFQLIMRQLVSKIEALLSCHDCVVVPGLGGFLMNPTEAQYDEASNSIFPSYRQVSFNSQLTFNDGLLIQAYIQENGVSYNEANQSVRQAVAEISEHLSAGESLQLGNIGSLKQTQDGRLIFMPVANISLDADAFGLEPVTCLPIEKIQPSGRHSEKSENEAPVVDITLWKWAVSVAACLALAVALPSRPLQQGEPSISSASIFSPCTISQHINRLPEPAIELQLPSAKESAPEQVAVGNVTSLNKSERNYLLIVASFATREEAERYIQRKHLTTVFPSSGIAIGGERYRVFAEGYATKEEATVRIASFRSDYPDYSKAWVTSGKVL